MYRKVYEKLEMFIKKGWLIDLVTIKMMPPPDHCSFCLISITHRRKETCSCVAAVLKKILKKNNPTVFFMYYKQFTSYLCESWSLWLYSYWNRRSRLGSLQFLAKTYHFLFKAKKKHVRYAGINYKRGRKKSLNIAGLVMWKQIKILVVLNIVWLHNLKFKAKTYWRFVPLTRQHVDDNKVMLAIIRRLSFFFPLHKWWRRNIN